MHGNFVAVILCLILAYNDRIVAFDATSLRNSRATVTKLQATQNAWVSSQDKVKNLRRLLSESESKLIIMPCCYDGLTARLVEQAGFELTFMTGFGVSATYGLPDTG
jgi:hypothetical protein